jgi:hypothetical protein
MPNLFSEGFSLQVALARLRVFAIFDRQVSLGSDCAFSPPAIIPKTEDHEKHVAFKTTWEAMSSLVRNFSEIGDRFSC